jgi:hypothetical protein
VTDRFAVRVRDFAAVAVLLLVGMLTLSTARADATTVVNGDFETGNLSGWTRFNEGLSIEGEGSWYAYFGSTNPIAPEFGSVPPPPQGNFAAITAQSGPGLHILYQDVALEPGYSHVLSLLGYYTSQAEIASPENFSWEGEANQQYRIDVIKPTAPLTTLNPADILATLLHTETGDPTVMPAQTLTADLTPYGGQTVRLRFLEVDNEGPFAAGVDAVSITGPPPAPPAPSNVFTFGKLKLNKKKGTAKLTVNVPGPGALKAVDVKKKGKRIKKATASAAAAGAVKLTLKPTAKGMKTLKLKGKLAFKALVTFTPTGGTAASQTRAGKLKLTLRH